MSQQIDRKLAEQMAALTISLLEACQEKQARIASSHGFSVAEFKLLKKFDENGPLPAGELARRMQLSSSRITRILDRMVAKSVVSRMTAKDDRRVVEVALTDRGREILEELNSDFVRAHEEILGMLPHETSESVVLALEKLDLVMAEWVKSAPPQVEGTPERS